MTHDSTWPPRDGSSGIPDYLASHIKREETWFPDFFTIHFDKESECLVLADQAGFIPTEDEFWSMMEMLSVAYERIDHERIATHNRTKHERLTNIGRSSEERPKKPKRKAESGYVYVLEGGGVFKIGRAKDPERRAELLAIQLPYPVSLICAVQTSDYKKLEADLHERFALKRLNGEWFDLTSEDVAYITGLME